MQAEIGQVAGQTIAQLQRSEEFLKKEDSTVMRQTSVITGDFNVSR
jgi:hypothetical protein